MGAREKRPARLRKPWPPTDAADSQDVTVWDDWGSVAKAYNRDEVWDIIYYNFETYNPDEVNWYLREYLGCTLTSRDGFNYRFGRESGNTKPMTVYIPDGDWMPPGPHQKEAKAAVLAVLREAIASNLAFKVGSLELKRGDLTQVARAIESGKITVIHRPSLGFMAFYDSRSPINRMAVSFDRLPPLGGRALIVHESTHAAMDIRKVPHTMEQSEATAYIAQALYLRRNGLDIANTTVTPSFAVNARNFVAWSGIFGRASAIAEAIDTGDSARLNLILLGMSIDLAPSYENEGAPANDGI